MPKKAIHKIFWSKLFFPVAFEDASEIHKQGWKTVCGEYFWKNWLGTTENNQVTCKRCINILTSS